MTVDIRSIRRHLDSLRGVLTDDESAELDRLMQKHDRATALEVHAETAVSTVAESVAASLPAGASDADLIEAASKVPAPGALKLVASRVGRAAEREARNLVTSKRADLIAMLNGELDAVRKEAAKLLPSVLAIANASDAIRAGKSKEWTRAEDLHTEHKSLRREIDSLRSDGFLPSFKGHDGYGIFRHPETEAGYYNRSAFQQFAEDVNRHAYVPVDQSEVDQVRAADQKASHVG
ncbi:hypothetical protein GKZ92_12720 [Gordonia sp. 135]|uniref:hypothetical protein n=1 Tax=Gordonia sp. 135 TaxID=2676309 RepID=UPI0012BB35FB|nr:hypothetical protein [Gordonia sp. 135]QGP88424.1 hypothetical protein GKZ92_12720 [Gordonia sp. 135]